MKRRLAAILAADIAGYSRLMGHDETGTLVRLQTLFRDVIRPSVRDLDGRIVKLMGDGLLAEFGSVVNAVECATSILGKLARREEAVPRERRLQMRIGINLGDVILDGSDVFGDGVNIAARLEQMAEPGTVCLSGSAHEMAQGRVEAVFTDLGEKILKNIARPVRVFSTRCDAAGRSPADAPGGGETYSVAVLPFDNMSGDPDQSYFSDGISEDVITDLSRIPGLFVAARNSSFAYKGKAVDIREVAKGLGVRHVLEGSVRRAGDQVRITAQLIDGESGGHVWAERYDRSLADIFAVQDEITGAIVSALRSALDLAPQIASSPRPEAAQIDGSDYDTLLRARHMVYQFRRDPTCEAIEMLERLIEARPLLAQAHADLSVAINTAVPSGWLPAERFPRAFEAAAEAARLAPDSAIARRALSLAHLWRKDLDGALEQIEIALKIAPSYAEALMTRGHVLLYLNQLDEAVDDLETCIKLDRHGSPIALHFLGHALYLASRFEEAAVAFEKRIAVQPQTDISRGMLVCAYGQLGRTEAARRAWEGLMEVNPNYSVAEKARLLPYRYPEQWQLVLDGFARAGIDVAG